MPTVADLKQAFHDTKINLLIALEDTEHLDPVACQWLVWHLRHKTNSTLKLEDVTEFGHDELSTAVHDFFQRPSPQSAVSTTGSPESTSASGGSDGASPTSTPQA